MQVTMPNSVAASEAMPRIDVHLAARDEKILDAANVPPHGEAGSHRHEQVHADNTAVERPGKSKHGSSVDEYYGRLNDEPMPGEAGPGDSRPGRGSWLHFDTLRPEPGVSQTAAQMWPAQLRNIFCKGLIKESHEKAHKLTKSRSILRCEQRICQDDAKGRKCRKHRKRFGLLPAFRKGPIIFQARVRVGDFQRAREF